MAIVHTRGNRERTFLGGRNAELIAHQGGTAGLYSVVIRHRVYGPDLVIVYKAAIGIDGSVSEAMSALVKHAVRFQEATVIDLFSAGALDQELDPRLI